MKKISLLLTALSVLVILSGCGSDKTQSEANTEEKEIAFTAFASSEIESDYFGCPYPIINKSFEDFYTARYGEAAVTKPEPESELTVTFDGQEYTGKFTNVEDNSLTLGIILNYYSNPARSLIFAVDAADGTLRHLRIVYDRKEYNTEISDEMYEICRNKAQQIAERYIDTDYFVLEEQRGTGIINTSFIYRLYFEGEPTESRLSISFSPTGKLYSFAYYVTDGYKAVVDSKRKAEIAELLLSEKADQMALDEVNEIFKDGDIDKIKLSSCNIYILPDGIPVKRYNFQTDKLIETEEEGIYTHAGSLVAIYVVAAEAD